MVQGYLLGRFTRTALCIGFAAVSIQTVVAQDVPNRVEAPNIAMAVVDFLVGAGVEAERLQARGYGESQPIDSDETDAGRERKRRVEFRVLSH